MENNIDNMAAWMRALNVSRRGQFLALSSHGITLSIRSLCFDSQARAETIESVRLLNEAHHRVAGYLCHLTSNDEDTGWLEPVASFLANCPDAVAKRQLERAWDHARSVIERRASSG